MKTYKTLISEIVKLRQSDFSGGKNYISGPKTNVKWTPLPGGSGLSWASETRAKAFIVFIADKGNVIGELSVSPVIQLKDVLPNSYEVNYITVDEDYQGIGIAKGLYGILLSILKITLIAGESQTPGGRRNWLSLMKIPGLEVKGLVKIYDDQLGPKKETAGRKERWQKKAEEQEKKKAEDMIDAIMKLGGEYLGTSVQNAHYFAFDVQPGDGELEAQTKTNLSNVYTKWSQVNKVTLFARWKTK